ncbi:MAG: pyrroline-5-carboxylate reductase [Cyclobacteriaceae bacterium]|nr:pyrroline-5-carboxylate reductase [Cyclobacteriaceae bacterium SS2]
MDSKEQTIAVIGAGNLGVAIAQGIVEKGVRKPEEMILTRRNIESIDYLKKQGFRITQSNLQAVEQSRIVMLCVQPKQVKQVIQEINTKLNKDHIIVSVITGVKIDEIHKELKLDLPVIRAMPNTAISIGESMTCIASKNATAHMEEIELLFGTLGLTLVIEEKLMQAATVLGASGIAFFLRFLRAATQGGIQMGFDAEEAQMIAVQTAKGAASLILTNKQHPEVEIDKVTTPEGCTIEGLNEMEHQGLSSALIKGLMVSYNKIKNIK